ncbi:hypothetical protein bas23_0050 [Escherichia phage WildeMaa]|nr:hypothetical protein bas23_0050 [Escherichia phage WildeMaa]
MTDYSKLTDSEINTLVARYCDIQIDEDGPFILDYTNIDSAYFSDGEPVRIDFDPCSNASQGLSILEENNISLLSTDRGWTATTDIDMSWLGVKVTGFEYTDARPFRAVMIVFLMLKEAEQCTS